MTPIFQAPKRFADATWTFFGPGPKWLRVVACVAVAGWVATAIAVQPGCAKLDKQAEVHDQIADKAEQAVGVIGQVGQTAEEALAWARQPVNQSTIALLPEPWPSRINAAIAGGDDIRPVLAEATDAALEFAVQQRGIASELRVKHAENNGTVLNILDSTLAIVLSVFGAGGVASVITRAIVNARAEKRGKFEGARQAAEIVNAGLFADPVTFRPAVTDGVAGDAMRGQMLLSDPEVAEAIRVTSLTTPGTKRVTTLSYQSK